MVEKNIHYYSINESVICQICTPLAKLGLRLSHNRELMDGLNISSSAFEKCLLLSPAVNYEGCNNKGPPQPPSNIFMHFFVKSTSDTDDKVSHVSISNTSCCKTGSLNAMKCLKVLVVVIFFTLRACQPYTTF